MKNENSNILIINGGSSSIKFALYSMDENPTEIFSGQIKRIGLDGPEFSVKNNINNKKNNVKMHASNFKEAAGFFIDWLKKQKDFDKVTCIGHRIVHGMKHTQAQIIDEDLLNELNQISEYDPEHLPAEIEIAKLFKKHFPLFMQVACFDTAFHTTIPAVAKTFAIPKRYYEEGVQRYGFHGISYSYLMQELKNQNEAEANGRIILAHLGNGVSLAAVKDGKCIDTSMGFTPAGGIMMSTRSGDLDPGVACYLMQKGMDAKAFNDLINHQSGLLGISGISTDMQDLLRREKENKDAALAIDIFCYQVKKCIGGYAAALGGLDILVFSGGIGENAPEIRERICNDLGYLNIHLNEEKNNKNQWQISTEKNNVKVYVIPTNEELMIAKSTSEFVNNTK
ncbi:acetate kinase [Pedobacter sp. CG_S7]|uniref:acetate/propionate family kinase n=1 Tax=Pedobacter sp. CG_S7 TaxID=3143930 RepID=UPI003394C309